MSRNISVLAWGIWRERESERERQKVPRKTIEGRK
jgi:hypothetical protein